MPDLSQELQAIQQYALENKEGAVHRIFDLIVAYAGEKRFSEAELLRKKLFEIDPMALTEIIRSAEIIEEKKTEAIDQGHRAIWSDLYTALRDEEANALFYAMKPLTLDVNATIFRQGERDSNLYFIDQGQLKLIYHQGGNEIYLKGLKAREVIGQDTFFHNSLCTTSLITLTKVQLNFIEKEAILKWQTDCPSLEASLTAYLARYKSVHELLKTKNLDRRVLKRVKMQGQIMVQLLDETGNPLSKIIKGELTDLSRGGLSFMLRITKKETALLLLGRKLNLQFALPLKAADLFLGRKLSLQFTLSIEGSKNKINLNGTVVSIRPHPFDDYSIHIKFEEEMGQEKFKGLNF